MAKLTAAFCKFADSTKNSSRSEWCWKNGNNSRLISIKTTARKRTVPFVFCIFNNAVSSTEVYIWNDMWRRSRTPYTEAHKAYTAVHNVPYTAVHNVPYTAVHNVPYTAVHNVPSQRYIKCLTQRYTMCLTQRYIMCLIHYSD